MESVADRLNEIKTQLQLPASTTGNFATTSNKRKFDIRMNEDEINLFKPLVKDIPILCDLPISFRVDILKLITGFIELEKGEQLISITERDPDIFVLYEGSLKFSKYSVNDYDRENEEIKKSDLFYIKENFKEINPVSTFGSVDAITSLPKDKWKPAYVYALEDSCLLTLNSSQIRIKMEEMFIQSEVVEKHDFLCQNIKGMDNIIASNRNKIIHSFVKTEYPLPKMTIVREGDIPNEKSKISIIKSGECKISSKKVPMKLNEQSHRPSKLKRITKKHQFVDKNGYFSQTTNSMQISIINENNWIGDEILVIGTSPYPFSVITNSKVVLYEITLEDAYAKIPKEVLYNLEKNSKKKIEFLQDRILNICKSVNEMSKWDNFYKDYSDRLKEVSMKFSQASNSAVSNLK